MVFIDEFLKNNYSLNQCNAVWDTDKWIIYSSDHVFYLIEVFNIDFVLDCVHLSSFLSYCNIILYNNQHQLVSIYENSYYVLLQRNNFSFSEIHLNPNFFSYYCFHYKIPFQWNKLWVQKSDYIEKYYHSIKGKYSIIDESIDYYLGLLELSISYISSYSNYDIQAYIVHFSFDEFQYYNPLNLKIDCIEREFAEYLKYLFFHNLYEKEKIEKLLYQYRNFFNYDFVIARMLFPSYYFLALERIVNSNDSYDEVLSIVSRIDDYREYVYWIIEYISCFCPIKKISF